MAATQQQQRQEGVIDPFTIIEGGEGLRGWGNLAYSGEVSAEGKAEGRGTIRCRAGGLFGGWTIRGAAFCNGAMLPCRAMFAYGNGDAFAGQLAASGRPADCARGAVVRGKDGGRFEGIWPACGADNHWFCPLRGAAWVRCDGSVYAVTLDGRADIGGDFGWQSHFDWDGQMAARGWVPRGVEKVHLGVLTAANPAGQAGACFCGQAALSGTDGLLIATEYEAVFAFADGRRLEGAFRGLCPQRGVLTDADGRRWRVAYSGDAWLAADMQPVTCEEEEASLESPLAGLAPDAAAAAAAWLRAEEVTVAQLRSGDVTDADLAEAGLDAAARAVIAAWRSRD